MKNYIFMVLLPDMHLALSWEGTGFFGSFFFLVCKIESLLNKVIGGRSNKQNQHLRAMRHLFSSSEAHF